MKLFGLVAASALALSAVLSSCVPDPVNNEEPNRMVVSPATLHLANPGDTATSLISLTCGCRFEVDSLFYLGDTNSIKYVLDESISALATPHTVRFFVPTGVAKGNYASKLAVYVLDDNGVKFYDTISVSMP